MKTGKFYITLFIAAVILLPIIFFPISSDLAIFTLAGKNIIEGSMIYKDFVDLKPPMIYYLFAVIYKFFGSSEVILRLFDYMMQLFGVGLIMSVVCRHTEKTNLAISSALIYSLLYSILSYNNTSQTGSFVTIPLIVITYLHLSEKKDFQYAFIQGLLIGCLIGIKYTYGIILIALIIDVLLTGNVGFKKMFLRVLFYVFGIIFVLILTFLPLFLTGAWESFKNVIDYTSYYSSMPPVDLVYIRDILKGLGIIFGDKISITVVFFAITGFAYLYKTNKTTEAGKEKKFLNFLFTLLFLLLLSILAEKKVHAYYFIRLYFPFSVFVGIGITKLISAFTSGENIKSAYRNFIVIFLVVFGFIFSPLPRWLNTVRVPILYFNDPMAYDYFYERSLDPALNRCQTKQVASYISRNRSLGDSLFVMATGAGELNYFLRDMQQTKFTQSTFYFGNGAIDTWKKQALTELKHSDWLVVPNHDVYGPINGHMRSSWESLKINKNFYNYVKNNFEKVLETDNFYVFKKTEK